MLLLRAVAGVISITCFFQSLNYLAVGTAVSLRYTSPIFAAIFLKEKIKPIQWLLFFIAFSGVLIIKGFGVEVSSIGLIFVLLSAIFLGIIFVVIRKIGNKENPLVIINYCFATYNRTIRKFNYFSPIETLNNKFVALMS